MVPKVRLFIPKQISCILMFQGIQQDEDPFLAPYLYSCPNNVLPDLPDREKDVKIDQYQLRSEHIYDP